MRTGTLFFAVIACAALTACASMEKMYVYPFYPFASKPDIDCKNGCPVPVTVTDAYGTCMPDDIGTIVLTGGQGSRKVTFAIPSGKYKFSNESYKFGFFVKVDPDKNFKSAKVQSGGKELIVEFDKKSIGTVRYTYGLNVQRDDNGNPEIDNTFCRPLDPWMVD